MSNRLSHLPSVNQVILELNNTANKQRIIKGKPVKLAIKYKQGTCPNKPII